MLRCLNLVRQRVCFPQSVVASRLACPPVLSRSPMRSMSTAVSEEPDLDAIAYGYMASQALFAALDIGIFDAIAKAEGESMTIEELHKACNISAPRLQTLATALVGSKILRRDEAGNYTLPKSVARFMVQDARHYYGDYFKFQIGKQFYQRMADLPNVMMTGDAPDYGEWFSDPETAKTYTMAQHNGSMATARALFKAYDFSSVGTMLDVGGGSGAFDIVFCQKLPELQATVLELPEVAKTGTGIVNEQFPDVAPRINFIPSTALDSWPVEASGFDMVLMSYVSGSVPSSFLPTAYEQAFKALKPGGRLVVHDFMVDDTLDGPPLAALWALQHVPVNAEGQGLYPQWVSDVMATAGFEKFERAEMIGGLTKLVIGFKAA